MDPSSRTEPQGSSPLRDGCPKPTVLTPPAWRTRKGTTIRGRRTGADRPPGTSGRALHQEVAGRTECSSPPRATPHVRRRRAAVVPWQPRPRATIRRVVADLGGGLVPTESRHAPFTAVRADGQGLVPGQRTQPAEGVGASGEGCRGEGVGHGESGADDRDGRGGDDRDAGVRVEDVAAAFAATRGREGEIVPSADDGGHAAGARWVGDTYVPRGARPCSAAAPKVTSAVHAVRAPASRRSRDVTSTAQPLTSLPRGSAAQRV